MTLYKHFAARCAALLLCAAGVLTATAQRLQIVDPDGRPVSYVCVTTETGSLIGSTDQDGWLADAKGAQRICLSHVAFQDTCVTLADTGNTIVMRETDYSLADVEVKPKELAYMQTYFRLIYFDDDGPIYFRGGVIDNTYRFSDKKTSAKTRSLSKGKNSLYRFLISTLVGGKIDKLGQMTDRTLFKRVREAAIKGNLTLDGDTLSRLTIADSICTLGYIDTNFSTLQRSISFNPWLYTRHVEKAEAIAKGKKYNHDDDSDEETFYEVYRIDDLGRSRIDDFVMRQINIHGTHKSDGKKYMLVMQAYATSRDYIDAKEYKQLRKDNKVDMNIKELKQFEQAHNIPPLSPNIQAQIDALFTKELAK